MLSDEFKNNPLLNVYLNPIFQIGRVAKNCDKYIKQVQLTAATERAIYWLFILVLFPLPDTTSSSFSLLFMSKIQCESAESIMVD